MSTKPKKLTIRELADFVNEFLGVAAPQLACVMMGVDGDSPQIDEETGELAPIFLSVEDTLAMWIQLPDCAYSSMFVGYLMAKGITTDQYTNTDVDKAVCVALTGGEKNVMFDWLGDGDATDKLN